MADFNDIRRAYFRNDRKALREAYDRYDPGDTDYLGNTLLHEAARQCDRENIEYLLQKGLRAGKTNGYGQTALFEITSCNEADKRSDDVYACTKLLLDARCPSSRKDETDYCFYHRAAQKGLCAMIRAVKDCGADCTAVVDESGENALHIACYAMHNYEYCIGKPEHDIAEEKYLTLVKLLVEAGIDPDDKNNAGRKPIDYAVGANAKRIAAYLSGDNDPLAVTAGGMTLCRAAEKEDVPAIEAIVRRGADVNEVSEEPAFAGLTPLMTACKMLRPAAVKALLSCGADPKYKSDGKSALYWLCTTLGNSVHISGKNSKAVFIEIFDALAAGIDLNDTVDEKGRTALCLLCLNADKGWWTDDRPVQEILAERLADTGADVDAADETGNTPVIGVCSVGGAAAESLLYLLTECGADLSAQNNAGDNAMIAAAKLYNNATALTLAKILCDNGFKDFERMNNEGKSAMDYATERGNEPLIKLLLSKM